jgi:hypothetical protein
VSWPGDNLPNVNTAGALRELDVHVAHLPPPRWDELDTKDARVRRIVGGHEKRPLITREPIDWPGLGLTPRWLGEDTSSAVAAIQPTLMHDRGADEWRRFIAGTERRAEVALAISTIGNPEEPGTHSIGGSAASLHLR